MTTRVTRTITIRGTGQPDLGDLRILIAETETLDDETTVRIKTTAPDRPGELTTWSLEITDNGANGATNQPELSRGGTVNASDTRDQLSRPTKINKRS